MCAARELSLEDQEPTMSAAEALGHPPGINFQPTDEELVELYLLPRACGQPTSFPGIVIEDDTGAGTWPWKLLARHGRTNDDEAYFFVRTTDKVKAGSRKDRSCGSRGTWVWQKGWDKELTAGGEQISWSKCLLNLHLGGGKSGSTGWVMHEYTVTSSTCPSPVKLCHVAFTGHGKKRQRVPDDDSEDEALAPQAATPQHKRVAVAAVASSSSTASTTTFVDQERGVLLSHNQERFMKQSQAYNQEQFVNSVSEGSYLQAYCALLASDVGSNQEPPARQPLTQEQQVKQQLGRHLGNVGLPVFPCTAPTNAEAAYHEEQMPAPTEQLAEPGTMPMDQQSGTTDQEEFCRQWGGLDSFCDVLLPENDYMATGTPAGDGCGANWDWESAFQEGEM